MSESPQPRTAPRDVPEGYRADAYARPSVTVDIVVFTIRDSDLKVLLIRRKERPYEGHWALPGGFVRVSDDEDQGEDLQAAAERELAEETGLPRGSVFLEQLQAFGAPRRDPRTRVITIAYYALVPPDRMPQVRAGSDAADARWLSVREEVPKMPLAFDHQAILELAVKRLRERIDAAPLAFELVPPTFTVAELRAVYEAIKGEEHDPGNFRRRFMRMQTDGILERAPGKRATGTKPARVYRFVRERA
ncbi:MAG: NUDIX hydrolase [Myxococcales bacterium]|nr:NUDIX hydrolase [Myxococcales bacterium]